MTTIASPQAGKPGADGDIAELLASAEAGDLGAAQAGADRLIRAGRRHPLLYQLRGAGFARSGRLPEALADLRAGCELAPGDVGLLNALGLVCMRLGRLGEAIDRFDAAARMAPDFAQSFVHRGLAQLAGGRVALAMDSLQAALALAPDHVEALGQAALLAAHVGEPGQARSLAERALALDPAEPNALRAAVEADIAEGALEAAEARLRVWLRQPDLGAGPRHHALGLLGDILERRGRPTQAMQAWTAGNKAFQDFHRPRFEAPGRPRLPAVIDRLTDQFDAASRAGWPAATAPCASPARRHVFLLSFMRSGTTLLEQMLAAHPDVVAMEEYEALADATQAFMGEGLDLAGLARLDSAGLAHFRQAYWREVEGQGLDPQGRVFLDKQPFNTLKLPIINRLFPDALVIFAQRDPRDVVLSCFQHRLKISPYSYEMLDLQDAANLYAAVMRFWDLSHQRLPLDVHIHRHEAFVAQPEATIEALARRLDLDPRLIANPGDRSRRGLTASQSARQIMAGVNTSGLERWRGHRRDLERIGPTLDPWIKAFGYPPDQSAG